VLALSQRVDNGRDHSSSRGAGTCNVNELFDTHFEQAERIEVQRGASSAFFDPQCVSSINVSLPSVGQNRPLELGSNSYV
jgi:hypothetical protein